MKVSLQLLALLLVLPQEDRIRDLVRRLDDDAIETREEAAAALVAEGAAAVPLLQEAAGRARGELKERIAGLIRRIDERERLAPTRISLEAGNRPAAEVFRELSRQSGVKIDVSALPPEAAVTASLKGVPFWKALDQVCRAHGNLRYEVDLTQVRILAEPPAPLPGTISGAFMGWLERIELEEDREFGAADKREMLIVTVRTAWEQKLRPVRIAARLLEVRDDRGRGVVEEEGDDEETCVGTAHPPGAFLREFALRSSRSPGPWASRLDRVRIRLDFDFPRRSAELKFNLSPGQPQTAECAEYSAHVVRIVREGTTVKVRTTVARRGGPQADPPWESMILRDVDGGSHQGFLDAVAGDLEEGLEDYCMVFQDVPAAAVLGDLTIRIPVELHTERFDLDLKDVPLK